MGRSILIGILALVIVGLALPAVAEEKTQDQAGVAFDLTGYYRVRYDNLMGTGWRFNEQFTNGKENHDSNWWSWIDQRGLLLPTMHINEKIALKAQVDLLRNVMFGNNAQATLPIVDVERNPSDTQKIETAEFNTATFDRGNIFSTTTSNNQSFFSSEGNPGDAISPVLLTRLWAEVTLPVGFLRFGRMPSDFGMGVFSNSGLPKKTEFGWEGLDKNFGDTYDRVMFGTKVGPYIPILIYDRVLEGDFRTGDKDVHEFLLVQYLRDIKVAENSDFNAGLYLMHRRQHSTDARIFAYDLWLKLRLGGFAIENEGVAIQGSMTQIDKGTIDNLNDNGLPTGEGGGKIQASAWLDAFRANYRTKPWGAGVEYGFSSPADSNPDNEFEPTAASNIAVAAARKDADTNDSKHTIDFIDAVVQNQSAFGRRVFTFPFNKDYQVDLITWRYLMGGQVKNGMYAKAGGYVQPWGEEFRVQADVIKSFINESYRGKNGQQASHDLGWEIDLDCSSTVYQNFFAGAQAGYTLVGPYFHDVYEGAKNVFALRMRLGVTF